MKKKIFFTMVFLAVLAILVFGVWSVLQSNKNNKLHKLIEQQKTNEAIVLISTMSEEDVNRSSLPLFLKQPINILSQGMRGPQFPLVKACEYGNYEIIEALLKKGADHNKFVNGGWSPIEAVFVKRHSNRLEIAKLLIEYGADPDLCGNRSDRSAPGGGAGLLHRCRQQGSRRKTRCPRGCLIPNNKTTVFLTPWFFCFIFSVLLPASES